MSDLINQCLKAIVNWLNDIIDFLFDYYNIPGPPQADPQADPHTQTLVTFKAPIAIETPIQPAVVDLIVDYQDYMQFILKSHNQSRSINGANPLKLNTILSKVASDHAHWILVNGPSILGDNRTSISARVEAAGYKNVIVGQNIACGFSNPQTVMHNWLCSAEHRSNIQRKQFKEIGIAMVNNIWCVVFACHLIMTERLQTLGYDDYLANELTPPPIIKS